MRIGARGSDLAQWQALWVGGKLEEAGLEVEQMVISTHGDRVQDRPLRELGVQGVFTKEIEEALLDERIDLAVHSCKDMALEQPKGLAVVALSERANPSDLLIIRRESVDDNADPYPLKLAAIVGTSAVRRGSQFQALRPDITLKDLRGNVPTRLAKLADGQYDAIFLAAAGIERLNLDLSDFHVLTLDPTEFIPSPAQGILAVEMRADDPRIQTVIESIHHAPSGQAAQIERAVLDTFGGGCSLPLGAYAWQDQKSWHICGYWGGEGQPTWKNVSGQAEHLALDLARALIEVPA
ncbi:hydroxymethylbilane synthase [bacterium]|nr:hydroxymethylbilane synthase [bacterium]